MSGTTKGIFKVCKRKDLDGGSISGGTEIKIQFYPRTYKLSKSSGWQKAEGQDKWDLPPQEWQGGDPMKLEMTLFFDTYESDEDVRELTREVEELSLVYGEEHEPKKVLFSWGKGLKVTSDKDIVWVLSSFSTIYKMFNSSGTPVRAEMQCNFTEFATKKMMEDRTKMQSPDHEKAYRVQPGDTLQSIAYSHYDDAAAWRPIASANNIEDPRTLPVGSILRVPRIR